MQHRKSFNYCSISLSLVLPPPLWGHLGLRDDETLKHFQLFCASLIPLVGVAQWRGREGGLASGRVKLNEEYRNTEKGENEKNERKVAVRWP